ncbi:MAG: helix-hairpin-helix domain-containing protein [Bacteroidota bacterium]
MKKQLKEYFYFSKSEKRGVVFLSVLIVLILILKYFLFNFITTPTVDDAYVNKILAENKIDSSQVINDENTHTFNESESPVYKSKEQKKLFYFNPNKVTASELKQLGCSDKLIKTWLNFTSKGGFFKIKTDVKKVYGISAKFYAKIEPYILIETNNASFASENKNNSPSKAADFLEKTESKKTIELNAADTLQLKYLPGIGSKFAERIVNYRNKLGGFLNKEQLKEVFGIDSILYNKIEKQITLNENRVRKISINTAEVAQLKQHPYFSYNIANAIVQYRDRHGKFANISDIKKVVVVNESVFKKIIPYLKL